MNSPNDPIDGRDWALLALLSVLWGGSFFFSGFALHDLTPLTLVFVRVALAAMILVPLLWAYRIEFPSGFSGWRPFFVIALLNNVLPFSLIVVAQTYIASGLASILNATTPLFTLMVMAVAGEEQLSVRRIAGLLIGLIGVAVLHGTELGFDNRQRVGILLCLAGAFSYGLSALYARRKLLKSPPLATATFQLLASSLMMAILAALIERPWRLAMPGVTTWLAMAGLAAMSTALAYIVFFRILGRSGSTNVMLVTLLIPVTALLLGYLILDEPVSRRELIGAAVIGSSLLLIDGRALGVVRRRLATA